MNYRGSLGKTDNAKKKLKVNHAGLSTSHGVKFSPQRLRAFTFTPFQLFPAIQTLQSIIPFFVR